MNNGFLDSTRGNKSSTRLYGGIVIIYAMIMGFLVLLLGYFKDESIIALAPISAATFAGIATPALVYMFQQKKQNEIEK